MELEIFFSKPFLGTWELFPLQLFLTHRSHKLLSITTDTHTAFASLFFSGNNSELQQFYSVLRLLLGLDFSSVLVLVLFLFRTLALEVFSPPCCHLIMSLREWQRISGTLHSLVHLSADLPSGPAELKVWQRPLCSSAPGQFLGLGWS